MSGMDVPQVGAPDPQRRTSPIEGLPDEEARPAGGEAADAPVCLFNGEEFPQGAEVQSGDAILRCERGRWVVTETPAGQPS
jgi:hypothetical protein